MRKMKTDAAKETALNLELNEVIRLQTRRDLLANTKITLANAAFYPLRLILVLLLNLRIKRTALRAEAIGKIID